MLEIIGDEKSFKRWVKKKDKRKERGVVEQES